MLIPTGRKYTVTVAATTYKSAHCEKCGCDFVYPMRRQAQGTGHSPLWMDNAGAKSRAETAAHNNLTKKLEKDFDPVPCPDCGWYQPNMVRKLKRAKWRWMVIAGALVVVATLIAGWIRFVDEDGFISTFTGTFWGPVALAGVAMIVAAIMRQSSYDPNANAQPPQVQNTNDPRLPIRKRDFDRLVKQAAS